MKFFLLLYFIFFPLTLICDAPIDLSIKNFRMSSLDDGGFDYDGTITYNNPTYEWDLNPNATGYQISSDKGVHWTDIGITTSYTFDGLANDSYYVVVRAYMERTTSIAVPLFGPLGGIILVILLGASSINRIRFNNYRS